MFNEFDCPHPPRLSHLIFGGIFTVIAVLSISCGGENSSNSPIDIPDSETTITSSEITNSSSFDEGRSEAMSSNEIIEVSSSSEKPVSSSSLSTEKSPYSSSEVKSSSSFRKNENSSSSSLIGESSSSLQIEENSSSSFYEKKMGLSQSQNYLRRNCR